MCGTATVSEALRFAGYRVIASDIMTFSVYHAIVRLNLDQAPQFRKLGCGRYLDVLWHLQSVEQVDGYFVREFSPSGTPKNGSPPRSYFTYENAAKIDAIRNEINRFINNELLEPREIALLRHDLLLAANRVANIAGTYGHYRSKWSNGSLSPLTLKPSTFVAGYRTDHLVTQGYAEELAPQLSADLCYLDPPYMKRQYAANYHIIETIARGDEPEAAGISGLRPWRDQYSNFCSKVKIRDAFSAIIEKMDCPHFLLSYNEDGLLTIRQLQEFLSQYGDVQVQKREYPRFRSNNSPLAPELNEYLFHLQRG